VKIAGFCQITVVVLEHLHRQIPTPKRSLHFAILQDYDSIGHSNRLGEIVGHEDNRDSSPSKISQEVRKLVRCHRIEATRWLIQQENARVLDQSASDAEPLVHSRREFHHMLAGMLFQANLRENLVCPYSAIAPRNVFQGRKEHEVFADRQSREEGPFRSQGKPDLPADSLPVELSSHPVHTHCTSIGEEDGRNQTQGCALAAAVRAEERYDLAG